MGKEGLLGNIFPDMEERVNKRMNELQEKLAKAIADMSHEIKDAAAPLIKALDANSSRMEQQAEEYKKLRAAIEDLTEAIKKNVKKEEKTQ